MSHEKDQQPQPKPAYEKPTLVCYGSLRETTKALFVPLPGTDALPGVQLYGDPS